MSKSRRRRSFIRWHRRLGVFSAMFVLLLAVSGVLLNHSDDLALTKHKVQSSFLLSLYGQKPAALRAFPLSEVDDPLWISGVGKQVFLDAKPLYRCPTRFMAAVRINTGIYVACAEVLLVLDDQGQLLDVMNTVFGLPIPIEAVAICNAALCIQSDGHWYRFFSEDVRWQLENRSLEPIQAQAAPAALASELREQYSGATLSWERVILDFHAGRFLGPLGPFVMDFVAFLFIILSVTGIYLWFKPKKKHKKLKKKT